MAPVEARILQYLPRQWGEFCKIPRSSAADIELALDAAHAAKDAWGATPATERSNIRAENSDRIEANLEMLAVVEIWDGKAVRETLAADLPLCVDHFRYLPAAFGHRKAQWQR